MTGAADVSTTPRAHVRGVRRPLGPWASFLIRRLARLVVSVWVLITFAFLLIHLIPGDPVRAALGLTAPPDLVERTREGLGLNDPLLVQYGRYMHNLFTGDFGVSMINRLPVIDTVSHRLPNTLLLAVLAFVTIVLIAIPLGLGMAILTRDGRRRPLELGFTSSAMVIAAIPEFLAAVMLVYVFAVKTGWFPIAGKAGPNTFVLPVAALSIGAAAALSRLVRVEVLGVLGQDFIRTARSKRLRNARIYLRHALPNTLTATLTVSGLLLSSLVVGSVLVETTFAWPGLGPTMVSAILARDYPMVQIIVLVYGAMVLFINLVVDLVLAALDPRSTIKQG
ncbi:MAG: ABC transporter permease [Actinomycetales bacterium]|jgi:ABC-type dipeptide/oligopeptide/nickel transport system permease component|uniref:ABC transporter permease n=1 Tax=Candidatus Phosphoribacter hodrii TaxID=2953743 RepID=A0A935CES3_9MICO|nr:ABC transporter permease [Candidatus Phosphoribacter hodrii]